MGHKVIVIVWVTRTLDHAGTRPPEFHLPGGAIRDPLLRHELQLRGVNRESNMYSNMRLLTSLSQTIIDCYAVTGAKRSRGPI